MLMNRYSFNEKYSNFIHFLPTCYIKYFTQDISSIILSAKLYTFYSTCTFDEEEREGKTIDCYIYVAIYKRHDGNFDP